MTQLRIRSIKSYTNGGSVTRKDRHAVEIRKTMLYQR
jgi:hypothetical protein